MTDDYQMIPNDKEENWWFSDYSKWKDNVGWFNNNTKWWYHTESLNNHKKLSINPQISIWFHFQDYNLLELDVKTNIELPFIVWWYTKDNEWLDYLLEYFEIKNLLHKDISQISWWEKERVSIVRTFANKPNIVLLDEAGAALDERLKNKLYDFIKKYSKENTILAISHDPNLKNLLNLNNQIYNWNFKILKQS